MKDSRRRASDKNAPADGHLTAEQNQFPEAPDPLDPGGTGNPNLERDDRTLRLHDFVFLSDNSKCWLIRTAHIWFLEACGDNTRVHLPEGTVLIRRLLRDCERRLDSSTFFRATRDFIINLTHVKQTRLLDSSRVLFVLPDGREVIASGRQNVLFRKLRAL
ncbi:MAG TPA: LytTR family DNA-binding domain-containing protein [Terrimicrobiaceae bacterium]